jgi:hypothetical protein
MTITNLAAFDAAIRAVCPYIDGVAADGHIFFQPAATAQQKTDAATAAAAYVDVPAQVLEASVLLTRLTDQEYTAFFNFAQNHVQLHRVLYAVRHADLSSSQVQTLIAALVTAGVITQQRATAVFTVPPSQGPSVQLAPPP